MKKMISTRVWLTVSILLVAMAAAWLLDPDNFVRSTHAEKNYCVANLKQIDGAIQFWAVDHKKAQIDSPDWTAVCKYLKDGQLPRCRQGGIYAPGRTIADPPTCSLAATLGHSLP